MSDAAQLCLSKHASSRDCNQKQYTSYLLLGQLFGYSRLLHLLVPLDKTLLHTLDAISLDVASADEDALQRSQTEVVV